MTRQVRNGYSKHRRLATAVTLVVLAAAAFVAVLPAFGSSPGDLVGPPSNAGVTPKDVNVGGSNFDCTANTGGSPAGLQTFQISAPPNSATTARYDSTNTAASTTPLPAGVTFAVTGVNGATKGKFFSFVAGSTSGQDVRVFHIGVNGGTDTAWYDYYDNPGTNPVTSGGVTADGNLHATTKSTGDFYNASITTFCYALTTTISGHVYLDNNANGSYNTTGTPADAGQNGWTVKLFNTSSSPAVQVGSVTTPTTGSDAGSYQFTGVTTGSNYKVCVIPPTGSGAWDETAPTSGTACSGVTSALPAGLPITNLQSAATGQDFGVEQTVTPSCSSTFDPSSSSASEIVEYKAQLTNPTGAATCKDAVVMYSYFDGSKPYAIIHPAASTTDPTVYWVVERIRMKVPTDSQNPVALKYDDTKPYGDVTTPMKMCKADPRTPGQNFTLAENPTLVMPDGTTAYNSAETTCMIQSTVLPSGGTYNYEAYIASDVDGLKSP